MFNLRLLSTLPLSIKRLARPRRHKDAAQKNQISVQTAIGIFDIMYIILEGLDNKDVASCALVCRDWAAIVHEVMWRGRSDSGVGIRPILGLLPEYYEESVRVLSSVSHIA